VVVDTYDAHDEAVLGRRQAEIAGKPARSSRWAGLLVANGLPVPFDLLPEPDGDPNAERLLELARTDYTDLEYDGVVLFANGVLHGDDSSVDQRAEALRLRAVANRRLGFDEDAVADADAALELVPRSTIGPVTTAHVWLEFKSRFDDYA
jgi:hypothetical protein